MQVFNQTEIKKKAGSEDDDTAEPYSLTMFNDPFKVNDVDVYLDEPIGPPVKYRQLLHFMRSMEKHDQLRIWINCTGGRADSMMDIIDGIQNAQGEVTVIVTGMAASAASIIALTAPKLIVGERAMFMCHSASSGAGGKIGEMSSSVEFDKKIFNKVIREAYKDFLTEEEIEKLMIGQDYWFDTEEVKLRLERRHAAQQAAVKKATTAAKKAARSAK
jgi:ATP-dependent protease ClpP protease subunit